MKGDIMTKQSELRPQEAKTRTVPLKDVIYWVIIVSVAVGGLITGWFIHASQVDQVKAEAASMVKNVKVEVEKVESK